MAHLAAHLNHVTWHAPGLSSALGFVPVALWELSLGIWLTFKGFNRSAPILTAPADGWGRADTSASAVRPSTAVATKVAAV